ncbi:MAG: response regulator [Pseudomonadota bacterium]
MNQTAPPVLLVEDDAKIADMLLNYLQAQGWQTLHARDGHEALRLARHHAPSVILLDLMLPGLDGMEVCRQVRAFSGVPIIMLTARVDEIDRLMGLESGADDYVCKPFSPREVVARVKAQWRRVSGQLGGASSSPGFEVREDAQRILWQGRILDLTDYEYRLLKVLLSRPGRVFSRAQLQDALQGEQFKDTSDRTIDSHIRNLRRKLESVRAEGSGISTVYGSGYRFEP